MEGRQQAISAILLAVVITTGAFVPFVQPATAQNESPAPTLDDVDIPDEVTVGESFEVVVDASNDGGRAGAYSTITVSSPDLDESGDGSQVTVTDDFDHSYSAVSDAGDEIFDKNGDSLSAEYALAEAGTVQDTFWDSGESRSFAAEITPEETGTLEINVRTTLIDDEDSSEKYTAPSSGPEDQQGYTVRQYEVEVKEETEISAEIEDIDPPSGDYTPGEDATAETTIRNTGNVEHEFYVGYSVRGPDDEWRDNDRSTHESVWVEPGEEETIDVEWEVEDDAPTGEYDIWTSVYRDADGDQLEDRLDESRMMDVFEVETETEEYRLNADTDGEGGLEVDPPGFSTTSVDRNYEEGTKIELTAKPGPDSRFVGWNGDVGFADEKDRTIEVTMNEARDITAEFEEETEEYRLNADTDGEGGFELYPPGFSTTSVDREYEEGTTVGLTATPGPDSRFVEWTGDIGSADGDESTIEVTMDEARDITARFEEVSREYRLEADTDGDGGFEVYPPGFSTTSVDREYEEGTSVELTATPGPDSRFVEWTGDIGFADETDRTIEVTMDEARDITAEFKEETKISAEIEDVDPPSGDYTAGEEIVTETTIRNTGNTEHEFYVGYSVRGPDGEWRDNDRSTHEQVWVEPGARETVDVEWQVEEDAPTGEYDIWTSVYRGADGDKLENKLDEERGPNVFSVTEANTNPTLNLMAPSRETTVTAGDTVEFLATATDDNGNLEGVDWYLENELEESTEAFGEEDEGSWTHTFDSAGTYQIEAQAHDKEDAYSEPLSWTVTVENRERIDARIEGTSTNSSSYNRGDTIRATVTVNNTGNTADTFRIQHSFVGPSGDNYGEAKEREIALTPGEQRSVTLRWIVNEDAPAGTYDTQVDIRTESDSVETGTPLDTEEIRGSFAVEQSSELRGTVRLADGGPVEDALVRVGSQQVRTDSDGEFVVESLPAGEYEVAVTADAGSTTREITAEPGETHEIDVEVGAAAEIINTVGPSTVEAEESFSLGIRVRNTGASERTFSVVLPNSLGVGTEGPAERQITLSEGESDLVRFDTTLYAAFSGGKIPVKISEGDTTIATKRHAISLQRTGLRLTFVDASGDILTDTRVVVKDAPTQYTNESGTIELTGLDPGEYSVEAGPATNPYDPVTVSVIDGEVRERRIQVSTGSTLELTVAGEQPIESARVTLYGPDGTAQTKQTNAEGKTSFRDLESGRYSVYVSGDAVNDDVIRDISVSGEQQVGINAEAAPKSEAVALSGQLTTKQGNPIEDATIRVSGRNDATEFSTDSNGQFRTDAEYLPDEIYTVRVTIDGAVWEYRKITPEEDSRELDLAVPDVAVATREAEEAGEDWVNSTTAGEALGSFVGFATESVKQSIFRGITPDRYSFDEISSEDVEEVDVSEACADTHVTATTECLASSNQLRHDRSIGSYGSIMGAASAFQNTVESVRSLPQSIYVLWKAVSNPIETVAGTFESFVYLTTHPEVLERIVERLPQRVIEQQKADNPFLEGSVNHNQFADAWYSGYVTFVAAEMVVARGAGKAAQASTYASKVSSKIDSGRAYLKTVGGRDQLAAYMRNRRNLPDPTDAPGYSAVIRQTGDDGEEFRERLSDDELALFLKLEQTDDIPRERLKQFVEDSGRNGAFLVKNSIDKGDSDMLRWLFTVDRDGEYADIWDEWREDVAQKYAISRENEDLSDSFVRGATHDDLRRYVGAVHKEATSDKIVDYREHMEKVIDQTATRNDRDGYMTELSARTREAESATTYARRNDVTQVVVEPEIEGTDKDIDLFVRHAGSRSEYIEVKEWTPQFGSSRGENMRDLLFGSRNGNAKFAEAENIDDGNAVVEVVVSPDHDRDELREIIENQIRTYREDGGEVSIDSIRIRDTSGTTQTGRITADDVAWGAVVGAAATSDNDGEDSEELDRIKLPDRPSVSVPPSAAPSVP